MLVVEQIEQRARERPGAPALASDVCVITFAELVERSHNIAAGLAGRGVGKGEIIGVLGERSPDLVIALLAIWKVGAVFLPLDPAYPAARLAFMLGDAGAARCIVFDDAVETAPTVERLREADLTMAGAGVVAATVLDDDPAYLIYTSGSTGTPKGVLLSHRGLPNLVDAQAAMFAIGPDSRVLQFASQRSTRTSRRSLSRWHAAQRCVLPIARHVARCAGCATSSRVNT